MSPESRKGIRLGAALLAAGILQAAWSEALAVRGARPDFLTATAILGAMYCDTNGAAGLGFFAGLLYACYAAPPGGGFGSLIVSRTIVCIGVGWLEERVFRDNMWIAVALVTAGTALVECLFFVFAPQPYVLHWARQMASTVLYNALLAIPLYLAAHRWIGPLSDRRRR